MILRPTLSVDQLHRYRGARGLIGSPRHACDHMASVCQHTPSHVVQEKIARDFVPLMIANWKVTRTHTRHDSMGTLSGIRILHRYHPLT
jgi:hypothetical protein